MSTVLFVTVFFILIVASWWVGILSAQMFACEGHATEHPNYTPLQAAVDLVTRLAPLELDCQEAEIEFDPQMVRLLDKCIAYIDAEIPLVDPTEKHRVQETPT